MQKKNNHRRGFLKNITLSLGSFVMLSGFEFKKSKLDENLKFKTLSRAETDEIIKNEDFSANIRLSPEPAPKEKNNVI